MGLFPKTDPAKLTSSILPQSPPNGHAYPRSTPIQIPRLSPTPLNQLGLPKPNLRSGVHLKATANSQTKPDLTDQPRALVKHQASDAGRPLTRLGKKNPQMPSLSWVKRSHLSGLIGNLQPYRLHPKPKSKPTSFRAPFGHSRIVSDPS